MAVYSTSSIKYSVPYSKLRDQILRLPVHTMGNSKMHFTKLSQAKFILLHITNSVVLLLVFTLVLGIFICTNTPLSRTDHLFFGGQLYEKRKPGRAAEKNMTIRRLLSGFFNVRVQPSYCQVVPSKLWLYIKFPRH